MDINLKKYTTIQLIERFKSNKYDIDLIKHCQNVMLKTSVLQFSVRDFEHLLEIQYNRRKNGGNISIY